MNPQALTKLLLAASPEQITAAYRAAVAALELERDGTPDKVQSAIDRAMTEKLIAPEIENAL